MGHLGRCRPALLVLVMVLVVPMLGASRVAADEVPDGALPFVTDKSTTLRGKGKTFVIDGPTIIPKGVEIRVELGTQILGINDASLDVKGGLKVHGTTENWVKIKNIDFSPTSAPNKGVHLDMADLRKCKWVHGEEQGFNGNLTIENSCLQRGCKFDFRMKGGFLKIMTTEFGSACRILSERQKENPVPIEVEVRTSWMKRFEFVGPGDANFRHSEIKEGLFLRNVTKVIVDGCELKDGLAIHQGPLDTFKKIKLTKLNVFAGDIVFKREKGPDVKKERIKLDKFWFAGLTDKKKIGEMIKDSNDESDDSAKITATWTKPKKRKHVLTPYWPLRDRPPPLL